jgi:hypothetical protein
MIAFASAFPEKISLHASTAVSDPHKWIIRTDDGVSVFVTEDQADQLAELLWNRNLENAA